MPRYRERTHQIRHFILRNVTDHPRDITALTAAEFGISRPAVHRHIRNLINDGLLDAHGKTNDRHYALRPIAHVELRLQITADLAEDRVWRQHILPLLRELPENVLAICQYGFTEMLNNVVDHSAGDTVIIRVILTSVCVEMTISDNGVGIFRKIQTELGLDDTRHAILELSKGKVTTDPEHHTGEGIFFTSRAFDQFAILSGDLYFSHDTIFGDWLLQADSSGPGTYVTLRVAPDSDRRLAGVFASFVAEEDDYGFTRTIVPVTLARYGDENLVSRSQAKRLLARFDQFREVFLDFKSVDTIGRAFADEAFRVYVREHPQVKLVPVNANERVSKMIQRVTNQSLER